jgi:hypothetical protein
MKNSEKAWFKWLTIPYNEKEALRVNRVKNQESEREQIAFEAGYQIASKKKVKK